MGWVNKVPYKHNPSACRKPQWDRNFGPGSTWQCDECQRYWRVTRIISGDQREGSYPNWETFTPGSSAYDR